MIASDYPFLDVLWTMFIFFIWIVWIWLLFTVFADIFRRHDISGGKKTLWIVFTILVPFLGVFVYLITQNVGMTERQLQRTQAQQEQFDDYVRQTAGAGGGRRPRSRRRRSSSTAARSRRPSSTRSSRRRSIGTERRASLKRCSEMATTAPSRRARAAPVLGAFRGADDGSRGRRATRSQSSSTSGRGRRERGLEVRRTPGGNLVIRVPATAGREAAPTVILQGHLDMVCERDPASPNDPAEGRIALVRDGEWLTADGTTLGADDGVAIAAMMALVEDERSPHGPLELLMTVAEEVGLEGANALDGSMLTGSILLNLDSEEDGALTVGCAGARTRGSASTRRAAGRRRTRRRSTSRSAAGRAATRARRSRSAGRTRSRCSGARSARRTRRCRSGSSRSTAARAGTRSRATRSPSCSVAARSRGRRSATAIGTASETIRDAFAKTDPGVAVDRAPPRARPPTPWTAEATARLLDAVALVPTGPLAMSPDFDGLVETSHLARRGGHRGRPADPAQPVALVERLGAARGDRDARRRRPARPAARSRSSTTTAAGGRDLDSPGARGGDGRLRAPVRRAADRHGGSRRARDRGHRR